MLAVTALLLVVLLYAATLLAVAWLTVHPPRIPVFAAPALMGEPQEEFECVTDDGVTIRGWLVPGTGDTVVVFCHGYLTNRTEFMPLVAPFRRAGFSCVLFDFRRHGWSGGKKCTFGIDEVKDLEAVVGWIRSRSPGHRIALYGSSMGAATAVFAAARLQGQIAALVLDGPYARLDEAGKGWWSCWGLGAVSVMLAPTVWVGRWLTGKNPREADTVEALRRLGPTPVLLLFGARDRVVPRDAAQRCVAAAKNVQAEWFEFSGHSEARFKEPERYLKAAIEFLRSNGLGNP
jgi:pimeloyl-ACP methyl ester carboxylesterase